ncbi:MAG TPA: hypothetical protein VHV51_11375, partial [Polyangiaceae bacterium]|nr:hypothetical protein [Polyangiaceae bacterium]
MDLFLGIDLGWREGEEEANETGVIALRRDGTIALAGWVRGLGATAAWMSEASAGVSSVLALVDAPLVITNVDRQRLCETETGQRYNRWKFSANSNNLSSPRKGGVLLRSRLEALGWRYDDGVDGPPRG